MRGDYPMDVLQPGELRRLSSCMHTTLLWAMSSNKSTSTRHNCHFVYARRGNPSSKIRQRPDGHIPIPNVRLSSMNLFCANSLHFCFGLTNSHTLDLSLSFRHHILEALKMAFPLLPTFCFLLAFAWCPSIVLGDGCDTKQLLGSYLNCLKTELDREYPNFEEELKAHTRRAAGVCFAQNIGDANAKERCVLAVADLDQKAWDRNGPLRDCSICRTFATGAIKAILSTPADEQKCIREQISKAIAGEASSCLAKKVPNFAGVPDIPDLEEGAFAIREQVIDSISDYIWIHSRLAFCAERKPDRAANTRECLKSPFLGYYQKHCQVLNSCDQIGAGNAECIAPLKATKGAVCECIDEARDDLKRRIAGIADAIREAVDGGSRAAPSIGSGSKVDQCVANIKRQLVTPTNDWASTIDNALSSCIKNKPSGQNLGIDSLLNVGCRKIIADTTGTAQGQIKAGFEFVNNLIDSMVERSRRFCGGAHCDAAK